MKTTKKIAALSLMLLFAVITAYSTNIGKNGNPIAITMVRHLVVIPSFNDHIFCGTYVVEIRNENGQLVAPPKLFVPGTSQYLFNERPVAGEGVRTAQLRQLVNNDPWQCEFILTAEPSTIKGTFESGKTYRYMLEPKVTGGNKE
jgi:hypothetical protein